MRGCVAGRLCHGARGPGERHGYVLNERAQVGMFSFLSCRLSMNV